MPSFISFLSNSTHSFHFQLILISFYNKFHTIKIVECGAIAEGSSVVSVAIAFLLSPYQRPRVSLDSFLSQKSTLRMRIRSHSVSQCENDVVCGSEKFLTMNIDNRVKTVLMIAHCWPNEWKCRGSITWCGVPLSWMDPCGNDYSSHCRCHQVRIFMILRL